MIRKRCILPSLFLLVFFIQQLEANNNLAFEDSIKIQKLYDESWKLKFSNPDSALLLARKGMKLSGRSKVMKWQGYRNISVIYSIVRELDSAEIYCNKAIKKAYEIEDYNKIAASYQNIGIVYNQRGNANNAIEIYDTIITLAKQNGDSILIIRNLNNLGSSYYEIGLYEKSLLYHFRALKIAEMKNDSLLIINGKKNISNVYYTLGKDELALKYALEVYENSMRIGYDKGVNLACNSLGNIYQNFQLYDSALKYLNIGLEFSEMAGNKYDIAMYLQNKGNLYAKLNKYTDAEKNYKRALSIKVKTGNKPSITHTYISLAQNYISTNKLTKAKICIDSANYFASSVDNKDLRMDLINIQKDYYVKVRNYEKAFRIADSLIQLKDEYYKSEFDKSIANMEVEYETEKKQQQLELHKAELKNKDLYIKQQKSRLLAIVSISVLTIIMGVGFIIFFRRKKLQELLIAKQNEELARQEYQNLFKESQLQAIREKITGQEEERARIARELHDGIGGTLAAIKMQMEQAQQTSRVENLSDLSVMIGNTYKEVRTISHNLMPPQFSDISIEVVLKNHIRELNKKGEIKFTIQFLPQTGWEKVPSNIQVELYRIVQELCTNIIKYSDATKVEIQLSNIDNEINLTIEDNGTYFDYKENGIGYRNLLERLKILGGSFEKGKHNGKGNTQLVQISLQPETNA